MFAKLRRMGSNLSTRSAVSTSPSDHDSGYNSARSSITSIPDGAVSLLPNNDFYSKPTSSSFLKLPLEIRQRIYGHLAADTALTLKSPKTPSSSKHAAAADPVNLLLTSRQLRLEYEPFLLSRALVVIRVQDYDFSALAHALQSQTDSALLALKRNNNLWLHLAVSHAPTPRCQANVQEWNAHRARQAQPFVGVRRPSGTSSSSLDLQSSKETSSEDEEEFADDDSVSPLPGDLPYLPQFHYRVRFGPSIRAPHASKGQSRTDKNLAAHDLLRSHLKMMQRVKKAAAAECVPDGEVRRMVGYVAAQAGSLERKINAS